MRLKTGNEFRRVKEKVRTQNKPNEQIRKRVKSVYKKLDAAMVE